jgi:predicted PolB exonuclease-like 3'-5' exonuclease
MPRVVFTDIESRPCPAMGSYVDKKGRPFLDKDGEPAFAPAPFHRVEMIGILVLRLGDKKSPGDVFERLDVIDHDDEAATLADFIGRQEKAKPQQVTWNGRGFDLPVIQARAMRHHIPFPWSYRSGKRYVTTNHMDLAEVTSNFGAASRGAALDHYARLVGWPGKLDHSGANVEQLLAEGKRGWLRVYCASDVILNAAVWLRVQVARGDWSQRRYRAAAESLLAIARSRVELAPWVDRVDLGMWLGPELPPVEEPKAGLDPVEAPVNDTPPTEAAGAKESAA